MLNVHFRFVIKGLYRKGQAKGYCDYPSCVGQTDDMIQPIKWEGTKFALKNAY